MYLRLLIIATFVCSMIEFSHGYTTVKTSFFKPGTNCGMSTGQIDSTTSIGYCLPKDNRPEDCDGKASTCGVLYNCEDSTVSISYWWSSGTACLRGDPQAMQKYPVNTCLPPSIGYNSYNNSDTIFRCL